MRAPKRVDIGGVEGVAEITHGDNGKFMYVLLWQAGVRVAGFSMDYDIAERFAQAILDEIPRPS